MTRNIFHTKRRRYLFSSLIALYLISILDEEAAGENLYEGCPMVGCWLYSEL